MVITPAQLKKLIDSDEALKIDRKEMFEIKNDHQKKEFAKDVSAIANTPGPRGFLLYGIVNDKRVKGISRSDFKEEQMQQVISSRCDPPVRFLVYIMSASLFHL
jgi:predicted HTH transcriptional regulator